MRIASQWAVNVPGRRPISPEHRVGSTCNAKIELTPSKAPAAIICRAPAAVSSAGCRIARQLSGQGTRPDFSSCRSAAAACVTIAACASWPQACITPSRVLR